MLDDVGSGSEWLPVQVGCKAMSTVFVRSSGAGERESWIDNGKKAILEISSHNFMTDWLWRERKV
jgi:hypothetical protein